MHVATGRVKRMSAGFASTWGATPATHTKQPTFATCTIFVWLHEGYATTEPDNAAYIVAACNAVPMLVEMVKYLSEEASGEVSCSGEWVIRTSEEVLQDAYQATEPKE